MDHHPLTDECLDGILDYLNSIYDDVSELSRVERYYYEYEERLLNSLTEGSDGAAATASRNSSHRHSVGGSAPD